MTSLSAVDGTRSVKPIPRAFSIVNSTIDRKQMLVAMNSTWLHTPLGSLAVEILPHIQMRKNDRLTNEVKACISRSKRLDSFGRRILGRVVSSRYELTAMAILKALGTTIMHCIIRTEHFTDFIAPEAFETRRYGSIYLPEALLQLNQAQSKMGPLGQQLSTAGNRTSGSTPTVAMTHRSFHESQKSSKFIHASAQEANED